MPRPASDKRDRLTGAALALSYARGFERTTIGDIAEEAGVAPGSVYYYFKTKDDVGRAIVDAMMRRYSAELAAWEASDDPAQRLLAYVGMYVRDADNVTRHGCPIGSMCADLRKFDADLGDQAAGVFRMSLAWAAEQFGALGASDPEAEAMRFLTEIQGAAVLANALGDDSPLTAAAARIEDRLAAM